MSRKRYKISVILCVILVGLIFIINAVQGVLMSTFTKKSTGESYAMDCSQITNAYSLAIANKISEYMNQMTFYSNADVVPSGDDQKIITWLKEHNGTRKTYFSSIMYAEIENVTCFFSIHHQYNLRFLHFSFAFGACPCPRIPFLKML